MRKDKLIELCYFLIEKNIDVSEISDNIKYLSNEDIDIVLKSKYPKYMILLLSNDNFRTLDYNSQKNIISIAKTYIKKKMFKYILSIINDDNIRNYGLTSTFVKIINNSYGEAQAKYASLVAKNQYVLKNSNAIELVTLVSNAITDQSSQYSSTLACNLNVLYSGKSLELVDIISKCYRNYQSEYAYNVASDTSLLFEDEEIVELTKIVSNSAGFDQAYHASIVARNKKIRAVTNIKDLVRILAYMPNEKVRYLNFRNYSNEHISYLIDPKEIVNYYYEIYRTSDVSLLECLFSEMVLKINKKEEAIEIDSNNIWSYMKHNPKETINILKELDDNIEIKEDFSLKRK